MRFDGAMISMVKNETLEIATAKFPHIRQQFVPFTTLLMFVFLPNKLKLPSLSVRKQL